MKLNVVRADPAGNITLFVLDPVAAEQRAPIAAKLMAIPELKAEQVGYACPAAEGLDGRMEMSGGEFCGNASRAYGMLTAKRKGLAGKARLTLQVSGSDRLVGVDLDTEAGTASADMPLPRSAEKRSLGGAEGVLVDLGGIVHFVVHREPDGALMDAVERFIQDGRAAGRFAEAEAYGVIFLHDGRMTPLVKVPAAGSLVWEGSCGSGSLAAAVAESAEQRGREPSGRFTRDFVQPSGTVRAEIGWRDGAFSEARIGGSVTLSEPTEIEIEL